MKRFQQTEPKRKKLPAPILAIILFAVLLFLLSSVIGLARKQVGITRAIRQLKGQREALAEKQVSLEESVAYLQTREGKEQALRDKYRLVKPGEGLVVITDPAAKPAPQKESRGGFFRRFVGAMKNIFSSKD